MKAAGKHRTVVEAEPADAGREADAGSRPASRRGRFAWIGTAASLVLILVSLGVLWKLSGEISWAELQTAFTAVAAGRLGEAFFFVAVSYLFLTCYDALALRQLRLKMPYRITALASFTSYAVSFTLGFPLITAATIRYWIYSKRGLSAAKIAALTVIAGFTFWLGMGVVLGFSLIIEAGQLASLTFQSIGVNTTARLNQILGFGTLGLVLGYLAWVSVKRRYIKVRHWQLELPGATVSFSQMVVGIGDVCAATIRYWIYSKRGLSAAKIAALTVIAGFTFWLGMGVVLGFSLIIEAGQLASLTFQSIGVNTTARLNQILGFGTLGLVLGYLAWVSVKRRYIKVRHWQLELPGATVSFSQMVVGIGDVCAAAAVLYMLMPEGMNLAFTTFLAIYVLAAMLGIASNAPGGIGVFEATILLALSYLPRESVLGSLLLFRVCYYVVPFVLALVMLGVYEGFQRLRRHQAANDP